MSDITFDHKLGVVTSWLKSTFKERAVPEFEINEQTVSALYELAMKNKRRNHEQQLIINNNNRLAQEYQDEGELRADLPNLTTLQQTEKTSCSKAWALNATKYPVAITMHINHHISACLS